MDSKNQNLELINVAIQKLMEEKRNRETSGESFIEDDDENDQLLLTRLLSQVESLKGEGENHQHEEASKQVEKVNGRVDESKTKSESGDEEINIDAEEIVKELKNVQRQNCITHWLLSVMIVLTVAWQISEVSLILKIKDGFTNPFKHVGVMFTGMWKKTSGTNGHDAADKENKSEAHSLPPLNVREFPHIEFPDLNGNGGKH